MRQVWLAAMILVLAVAAIPAQAQDNLLTNGSMEEDDGPYQGKGRGNLTVPMGWDIWLGQGEITEGQYYNRGDLVYAFPHAGPEPQPASGRYAANIDGGYVQFNAALFQSVSIAPDTPLRAEAKSYVQSCNFDGGSKCGSNPEFNSETRIGIDPNGGSDPNSGEIIWSSWTDPHDTWKTQSVEATSTGGTVTVFLFATQGAPTNRNMVYWDDAELQVGGSGGSNAGEGEDDGDDDDDDDGGDQIEAPAPPPNVVPFVSAQSARDDGSIVHTVREGETVDSIAVAYGTTRDEILALNPSLPSARFIQIGQRLVIKEADESNDDDDDDNGSEEATEEPEATPIPGGVATEDPNAPDVDLTVTEEVAPLPGSEDGEMVEDEAAEDDAIAVADAASAVETDAVEDADSEMSASEGGSLVGSVRGLFGGGSTDSGTSAAMPSDADMVDESEDMAASSESVATSTPASELASVDITASSASVCVSLFEDLNQNRLREDNESLLSGGAVSINQNDAPVATYTTDGLSEPHCISELAPGDYVAAMTPPTGYGMTTPTQLSIPLTSGTSLNIEFGAAQGVQVAAAPPDAADELGNSADEVAPASGADLFSDNIIAISGIVVAALAGVVVVAGIGATILLRRSQ